MQTSGYAVNGATSNDTRVKLYGFVTSPFVWKVGVFLKYKQVPYELVPVNPVYPRRALREFPGQRRVPVLTIGQEWRHDSTPLGIWLDEVFPERPMLGVDAADTERILEIDRWVTDELLMGRFREAVEWENAWDGIRNGWKLARAVSSLTPLPFSLRWSWPVLVRRAGFVRRFASRVDPNESLPEMRERHRVEFLAHLAEGPFLGGRERPSLADLSAYATIVTAHVLGIHGHSPIMEDADVIAWCRRLQAHLPENPFVLPEELLERPLP